MSIVFFPSCKMKQFFPEHSAKAAAYLKEKFNIEPVGCCRIDRQKLAKDDTSIVLCTNCAAITEESSASEDIKYLWQIIDEDRDFHFPDYHGERMTLQDCWTSRDNLPMQKAVRSLLRKMNIEVVEMEENFADTKFCGTKLLAPCKKQNAQLAPKRYVIDGGAMFTPMSEEEQDAYLKAHCAKITTDKVITYCGSCRQGLARGGKQVVHLLTLLFPVED